jgi:hypothetical protein
MNEEALERRLEHEAQTVKLGELGNPTTATDTARVEVSYRETWDSTEHCGFYIVYVRCSAPYIVSHEDGREHDPALYDYDEARAVADELGEGWAVMEAQTEHPANTASDAVYARAKERNYDYFSVDDVYAA